MYERFKLLTRKEGFRPEVLRDLLRNIKAWIQNHILRIDAQLYACVREG
jgi:hemerythrin